MPEVKPPRPWGVIAQELIDASDPERILQLSQELTEVLKHTKYEAASVQSLSKLAQAKRAG